jgi:hypothetical protein
MITNSLSNALYPKIPDIMEKKIDSLQNAANLLSSWHQPHLRKFDSNIIFDPLSRRLPKRWNSRLLV